MRASGGYLAPGGVVGDGRYRLLAQLGVDDRAGAHLWRARDGQLRRDVALTLIVGDPADHASARSARRTLERAAHAAQFHHPVVARVLDVLSLGNGIAAGEGLLGVVVSEWSKGTDLIDVVGDGPISPGMACRMVEPLVDAVEQAHHSGLVLGLDHPQRIRRGADGRLRLAFPGALPDASLRDDIKALGALLYVLLTGRWPLEGGPAAIPPAPHAPTGRVVPPRSLAPHVPAELSSLAARTLSDGGEGGIRTSSAFLRVLRQVAEAEERRALGQPGAADEEAGRTDPDGAVWTTKRPVSDPQQRKKVALGATVLVVAAVGILAWLGLTAISFFQTDEGASGPDVNVAESSKGKEAKPPPQEPKETKPPADDPVDASSVTVYNPEGTGDFEARAPQAIDGDPESGWQTDQYQQQFPTFKRGVGLTMTFDEPINLSKVKILGASPGTRVEIRVADHPNPHLDDAEVVAGSELEGDETELTLDQPAETTHVIVWITQLTEVDGQFQSTIGEVKFYPRAS
ncbi:MAG: hypothetical protein GEU86_03215 [Actinophytocola sp.]|nr:hypothetical protein [Actinophytocola sp.]